MSSTQSHSPATSHPFSLQSIAASFLALFARRPLFSIACSLFSKNTRGGGSVPKCEPSFTHANSIASYHIHVSQAFSCNYALFCATAQRLLHCFQSFAHSFVVDRGWYPPASHRFQASFAFLLRARFADPHHAASHRAQRVLIQDQLDRLPASQPEISVQPEPALRGIHDQTRNSPLVSFEVDDQAGALPRRNPLQAAAFRNGRGGHCFAPWSRSSDAGIVSCWAAVPATTARACRSGTHSPARREI
jgi:hypothetical protein